MCVEGLEFLAVIEMTQMRELMAERVDQARILEGLPGRDVDQPNPNRSIPEADTDTIAAFHVGTVICLLDVPIMVPELGAGYMVALLVTTALIGVEHGLVDPESPESIHHAFFTINVWIASAFAILVLVDRIL